MANLILASVREVKSGAQMWNVYRSENNVKSDSFFFALDAPLKALRYAFILRKRTGAVIPKGIYNKLMQAIKAQQPQAESAPVPTASESAPATAEPSPIESQYAEMKAKHPDAILLYRVGDFYESYADDAKAVSEVLGIVLTRHEASRGRIGEYQAAFPAHALDSYLPRLVRAGKRVAICDALAEVKLAEPEKKPRKRSTKKAENK